MWRVNPGVRTRSVRGLGFREVGVCWDPLHQTPVLGRPGVGLGTFASREACPFGKESPEEARDSQSTCRMDYPPIRERTPPRTSKIPTERESPLSPVFLAHPSGPLHPHLREKIWTQTATKVFRIPSGPAREVR